MNILSLCTQSYRVKKIHFSRFTPQNMNSQRPYILYVDGIGMLKSADALIAYLNDTFCRLSQDLKILKEL